MGLAALWLRGAESGPRPDVESQQVLAQVESRLQQEPGNPRLWVARGTALERLGRDKESLQSFEKALGISPKFLLGLEGAAEVAYRGHDPKASEYLERIFEQDPRNAVAHGMAGALAFEKRDCLQAVKHFQASGTMVEKNPLALAQWGECLLAADQPSQAAERLQASLSIRPGDPVIGYNFALALHRSHRDEDARQIASGLKSDADVLNLQASIATAQGRLADAIAALRQAIALAPSSERNYVDLVSLCVDHDSYELATDVVNAGLAKIPASAALYTLRGAIAVQFSRFDEASRDFEQASRLEPDRGYGDVGLSMLLRQQDDIVRAIEVIRGRLKKEPGNPDLQFLLADLLTREDADGNPAAPAEALTVLRVVVKARPDMAKARALLGKVLLQAGKVDEAIAEMKTALGLDPEDRIALHQLVLALKRAGRDQEATAAAGNLRAVLTSGQHGEVEKNRVKLVKLRE